MRQSEPGTLPPVIQEAGGGVDSTEREIVHELENRGRTLHLEISGPHAPQRYLQPFAVDRHGARVRVSGSYL
jgi:hypothetical protein